MNDPVIQSLENLIKIRKERNAKYNDVQKKNGNIMLALFCGKIPELKTADDINKFCVLSTMINKLSRYCENFSEGHEDSLDDLSVYSQMLKELYRG